MCAPTLLTDTPGDHPTQEETSMKKTAIALALAGAALLAVPATASAKPPTKVPPPPEPYTINLTDQDTPCGAFTLLVHDGETYTTHVDRFGADKVTLVHGKLDFTLTSDVTHKSLDLHIPGPGPSIRTDRRCSTGR